MKKSILLLVTVLASINVFSQTKATTEDGKKVILMKDGTWKYEKVQEEKALGMLKESNSTIFQATEAANDHTATNNSMKNNEPPKCEYWRNINDAGGQIKLFTVPKKVGYVTRSGGMTIGDLLLELRRQNERYFLKVESTSINCVDENSFVLIELENGVSYKLPHTMGEDCSISPPLYADLDEEKMTQLKNNPIAKLSVMGKSRNPTFTITNSTYFQDYLHCLEIE